ncbi:resuscitation-promoting factor, partial [Streptomyces sp. SID5998]|nr:resuscitation-promoting factor [Streptomyces sp. SID5998]
MPYQIPREMPHEIPQEMPYGIPYGIPETGGEVAPGDTYRPAYEARAALPRQSRQVRRDGAGRGLRRR